MKRVLLSTAISDLIVYSRRSHCAMQERKMPGDFREA